MGFGGAENGAKGGAAGRVPKLRELLRAEVEARAEEVIAKLFAGLHARRAVVVGTGPKAHIEIVEDEELILKTVREIFDRAEGRPTQRQEVTGDITHTTQSEFDREVAELDRKMRARMNGKAAQHAR